MPSRWLLLSAAWALLGVALVDLFFRYSEGTLDANELFNADSLYLPTLYRDLFEEGGRWAGWRLTPAPYFFPDMGLYFLLDALSGPFLHAILAFAVVQQILLVLAVGYLMRTVAPGEGVAVGQVLAMAAVSALLLAHAAGSLQPMVYALLSAFHFSVVLLSLVALALALRTFRGGSRAAAWLLGAVCVLASASDSLFVVAFTVPAGLCLLLLTGALRPRPWRRLGVALGVMAGATLVGFQVARRFTVKRASAGFTRLRLDMALESFGSLREAVGEQLRAAPLLGALWLGLVLTAVAVVVARRRRWTTLDSPWWGLYAVCLYAVLAVGANVSAVVLTGLPFSFRYTLVPLLLPFLLVAFAGARVPHARWRRWLSLGALGLAAVAWGTFIARHPWRLQGPLLSSHSPPLVECLDRHQASHGLAWGVSDYWNAKLVSMFSRTGLRVNQLAAEGHGYHWINNSDWYLDRRGPRSDYNFVITSGLDMESFQRRYGPPRDTFRCEGVEILVYGEGFDAALRAALAERLTASPP